MRKINGPQQLGFFFPLIKTQWGKVTLKTHMYLLNSKQPKRALSFLLLFSSKSSIISPQSICPLNLLIRHGAVCGKRINLIGDLDALLLYLMAKDKFSLWTLQRSLWHSCKSVSKFHGFHFKIFAEVIMDRQYRMQYTEIKF